MPNELPAINKDFHFISLHFTLLHIYFHRNPKDVAVSFFHHVRDLVKLFNYDGKWNDYWPLWMEGKGTISKTCPCNIQLIFSSRKIVKLYKCLIVSLVFSHLGFWSGNLFLIAPFPDLCLLVPFHRKK